MNYKIIATGSDGNATLVNGTILIDCGVPFKMVWPYSHALKLVLLTHKHGDHFKPSTVKRLALLRPTLRFACCDWMVKPLLNAGVDEKCIDVFYQGELKQYEGLCSVQPWNIPHDVPNCCWTISDGYESLFYATDTGSLDGVSAKGCNYYLVEANHRRIDLEARAAEKEAAGEYAYEIRAAENHLSYEQAVDWLTQNMTHHSFWIPMHEHVERSGGPCRTD